MKVMGIDPGLQNLGWAVIEFESNTAKSVASGTIKSKTKDDLFVRLSEIEKNLEEKLKFYAPSVISIESVFIGKGARSMMNFMKLYGVVISVCLRFGVTPIEIPPTRVKKTLGGGRMSKQDVLRMIKALVPGADPASMHESDAYAIAYTATL